LGCRRALSGESLGGVNGSLVSMRVVGGSLVSMAGRRRVVGAAGGSLVSLAVVAGRWCVAAEGGAGAVAV
jgi:hypothetical protein